MKLEWFFSYLGGFYERRTTFCTLALFLKHDDLRLFPSKVERYWNNQEFPGFQFLSFDSLIPYLCLSVFHSLFLFIYKKYFLRLKEEGMREWWSFLDWKEYIEIEEIVDKKRLMVEGISYWGCFLKIGVYSVLLSCLFDA